MLPEMVEALSCDEFLQVLLDWVCLVWKECCTPKDWSDAILVHIQMKDDHSSCAWLDVVGKVVARVLQKKLVEGTG